MGQWFVGYSSQDGLVAREAAATGFVVEYKGAPIASVRKGFADTVKRSGIPRVTPHTMRHTAASWMIQRGVSYQPAGGWLSMSPETVKNTYGHHDPAYMREAGAALSLAEMA